MSRLTAEQRRKLPRRDFALPKQKALPINDLKHVQAAYGRASMMHNRGELDDVQYKRTRARITRRKEELQGKRKPRTSKRSAPLAKTHGKRRVRRVASNPTPKTKIVKVIGANPTPARKNPAKKTRKNPAKKKATTMRKRSHKRRTTAKQRAAARRNIKKAQRARRRGTSARRNPSRRRRTTSRRRRARRNPTTVRRVRANPESRAKRSRAAKKGWARRRRSRARRNPYRVGSPGARRFAKKHARRARDGRYTSRGRYGYARRPGAPTHVHGYRNAAVFRVRANPTGMVGTVIGGIVFGGVGFGIAEVVDRLLATRANQKNAQGQQITGDTAATGQVAADLIAQFSWTRTGVSAGIAFLGVAVGMWLRPGSWGRLGLVGAGLGAAVKTGSDLIMKKALPMALGDKASGSRLFPGEVAVYKAQQNNQLPSVVLSSMAGVGSSGCGENCGCARCTKVRELGAQIAEIQAANKGSIPTPPATRVAPAAPMNQLESPTARMMRMTNLSTATRSVA